MDLAEKLNNRLEQQVNFIKDAIAEIKNDNLVDMDPLDQAIAEICNDIEKADPSVAKETQNKMTEMIALLDELAIALDDFKSRAENGE